MSDRRDAQRGINILVIEGGGARGLSSLMILKEVMSRLQHSLGLPSMPIVREHFDVVAGTGTGAVIACMVGRLGMSVDQAIGHYVKLVDVFLDRKLFGTTMYKTSKLQGVLKGIARETTGSENARMMDTAEGADKCKTMIFAMSQHNLNASIPRIFRSYQGVANQMADCAIWEAVSASVAHPEMFKPADIGEGYMRELFIDGGLGCSNPAAYVLEEVKNVFPRQHVSSVLCIGTGHPNTIRIPNKGSFSRLMPANVLSITKEIAADSERVAQEMAKRFKSTQNVYFRLSVDQGMQNIGLSEWEKLSEVTAHARAYIQIPDVRARMDQAVVAIGEKKLAISVEQIDGEIQTRQPPTQQKTSTFKICPAPTPIFTGRQAQVDQITACISCGDKERCVFVLYGLGGSGKTQLALKTVEQTKHLWSDIVFVDATSHETAEGSLVGFSKIKNAGDSYEDALQWLGSQNDRWLMIIDNADDPSVDIKKFFPTGNTGSILVTTRITQLAMLTQGPSPDYEVSGMGPDEAMRLLLKITKIQEQDLPEAERHAAIQLFKSFGYLALAIVQAGAYIFCSRRTITQYRDMYLKHRQATLEKSNELSVKIDDYQKSVYTTWHMSYQLLSTKTQHLLHLMAFLHHDGIIEDIFRNAAIGLPKYETPIPKTEAEINVQSHVMECLGPYLDSTGTWDSSAFLKTMTELLSYSLITYDKLNNAYTLHVLVHDWVSTVVGHPSNLAVEHTALLLALSIDRTGTEENMAYLRKAEVHLGRVLEHQPRPSGNNAFRFEEVYYSMGRWHQREKMCQTTIECMRQTLGETHVETIASIKSLASTYQHQGRYQQAITLLSELLDSARLALGDEHHTTLDIMLRLANNYRHTRRSVEAESLLLRLIDIRKRKSGDKHDKTLEATSQLGSLYYGLGRYREAEELQIYAYEARRDVYSDDRPALLKSMSELATTYQEQRRFVEAEELQLQVVKESTQLYRPDHPETLAHMSNLASIYRSQGQHEQAEDLFIKVVDGRKQVLGVSHPRTLHSMEKLSKTYRAMGTARRKEYEALRAEIKRLKSPA